MTLRLDGLSFKSDDGKENLLVTTVPFLKTWSKTADAGLKWTDDVAVIFDNEIFIQMYLWGAWIAVWVGRVAEEQRHECLGKYLAPSKNYSRLVSEMQARVDEVV
ncbi:hypothetical protein [Burkholderia sp. NRF60-BP8]|uniref:hypothetical protein n=1 Tax=Burkholderia sp. NRF60-BP8 TaxID=1637853 RepID=UPI0007530C49|nr:hypothetical protein [Burkholderia sp. NRF60-BP8]AOI75331.1 hypothetical protein WS54_03060 [Burkholderia sp. NRF60-BP8]KVA07878.1 hypothetical protein WS54_27545 [Burkholderia sp. NRF60-BP8]